MKRKAIILLIALVLTIGFVFVAGPTPAAEQKVIKWRMASCWSEGVTRLIWPDKHFCERVKKMSNGQLDITLYSVGKLCKAGEIFDMVESGAIQAGGDVPCYWSGKNTAFDLLCTSSVGFCAEDYLLWIYQGGGFKLYQEMYGKHNCAYFPHSIYHVESGIRSNKPIKKLSDLKGMKIRMSGILQGKLLQHFGGTPAPVAFAEIYEALRRGTIDGAEFSGPAIDQQLHVEEITKYWLTPGWHQTSCVFGVLINKKAFNSLPDHLKAIVESAAKDTMVEGTTYWAYLDGPATQYFIDSGITVNRLSDADIDQLEVVKNKIVEELATKNPDYAKVLKSQTDYLKLYAPCRENHGAFGFGRNPKAYPKIK